jgi:hypothetical protein
VYGAKHRTGQLGETESEKLSQREGDPKVWSTVPVTALGSWWKHIEGDPKGQYTVLRTALGSVLG